MITPAELPVPSTRTLDAFGEDPSVVARDMGGAEKAYQGGICILRKNFGPLYLDYNFLRETVCRRVVVGEQVVPAVPEHTEKVYEWVCDDPVLSK